MSSFEDRLWSQLVDEHGHEMGLLRTTARSNRRRPALVTVTALAMTVAVAAAVLVFTAGTAAPPAYAVTTNSDGSVTVTLNDIAAITALNAELARDGINAKAIPMTADCPIRAPQVTMPAGTDPSRYTVTIVPRDIPAGYTGVFAVGKTALGQIELLQGSIEPPLPACFHTAPTVLHPIDPAR